MHGHPGGTQAGGPSATASDRARRHGPRHPRAGGRPGCAAVPLRPQQTGRGRSSATSPPAPPWWPTRRAASAPQALGAGLISSVTRSWRAASPRARPWRSSSGQTCRCGRRVVGAAARVRGRRHRRLSDLLQRRTRHDARRRRSLGAILGYFLPAFVLRFLARRRCKKFEAQLPDVLMLVASSLSTGFSLLQALDAVAKDAAQPAAKEFSRALAETRIGADISDSLERMAHAHGQRQHEVGNHGDPDPAQCRWQLGRDPAHHGKDAAGARGAVSPRPRSLGRGQAVRLHPDRPADRHLPVHHEDQPGVRRAAVDPTPRPRRCSAGGIVSLGIGIFWMRKVVDVQV